jgi:hypothetical protein
MVLHGYRFSVYQIHPKNKGIATAQNKLNISGSFTASQHAA